MITTKGRARSNQIVQQLMHRKLQRSLHSNNRFISKCVLVEGSRREESHVGSLQTTKFRTSRQSTRGYASFLGSPTPSLWSSAKPSIMVTKTSAQSDTDISSGPEITVTKTSEGTTPLEVQSQSATTPLEVTKSCADHLKILAANRGVPISLLYLRVYVDAGGCSGFQYKFEVKTLEEEPLDEDEDVVISFEESKVVVDNDSLELMRGSRIDFVTEMIRSGFEVVDNPQSESACGCGSSFAIKNFEENR